MNKLTGLIAAPFTPFDETGEIDIEIIPKMLNMYERNGVNGAFIAGTTGECASLSHEEKKLLNNVWSEVESNSVKKIFMCGGTSINEIQELAELSQENGMDAISILSPYFIKPPSVEALVEFCKACAEAAPELLFYYYHIPGLTGANFPMLEFLKLADESIPQLKGIKYSLMDLYDFQACKIFADGKYNMLWGSDETLMAALAVGADGGVGSTYNYAAPLYNKMIKLLEDGDLEAARKEQYKSVQMVQLLIKYGGIGAGKAFMKLISLDCGWFRPPVRSVSEERMQLLKTELEEIGFFDFCNVVLD